MDRRSESEIKKDWDDFLAKNKKITCDVYVRVPISFYAPLNATPEEVRKLIERHIRKSCYLHYEIVNIGIPE